MKPLGNLDRDRDAKRARVLLCARAYPPDIAGGGEISTALLARGLMHLGVNVQVLTFTDRPTYFETVDGVPVHRLQCPSGYWSLRGDQTGRWRKVSWHLEQAVRPKPRGPICEAVLTHRPTILHSSTIEDFGTGLWRWASRLGIHTIHTLRSYNLLHRRSTLYDETRDRDIDADLLSLPKRKMANSLRGVVGISRYILNRHIQAGFFRDARTAVIANPCDHEVETVESRDASVIRIGILGRISPEKGIEAFMDSLRGLPCVPRWQLEIAGSGAADYLRALRERAAGLPISFVGWQSSRDFLRKLDLLAVPSRWQEPFGRIVVEAYSVGVPVICLNRGGLPELVKHEKTGWIVEDWNEENVAVAIAGCRELDRGVIRMEAQNYTVADSARQYLNFYQELLSS